MEPDQIQKMCIEAKYRQILLGEAFIHVRENGYTFISNDSVIMEDKEDEIIYHIKKVKHT